MTTLFADQKHILERADEFSSYEDMLEALRQDITVETQNLKREIEDIIKIVDEMKGEGKNDDDNSNNNKNKNTNKNNNN